MESAVLNQHRGDGAASLIQSRLDHCTLAGTVRIRFQFLHISDQGDHFQQVADAFLGMGGYRNTRGIAAPLLRHQLILGELLLDALRVSAHFIHFIDRHNDGNSRRLGVVDGLDGLGHDAVVGGYHQDRDIRHLGASGTHSGERLMAGRIQEGNFPVADINPVGADMLGNAAGLSRGNIGVPDGVQQRGFTVVNVSHDHYHRRSGHQVLVVILAVVDNPVLNGDHHFFFYLGVEFHRHQSGGIEIDHIVYSRHGSHHHQLFNDLGRGGL